MKTIKVEYRGNTGNNFIQLMVAESMRLDAGDENIEIVVDYKLQFVSDRFVIKKIDTSDYERTINIEPYNHIIDYTSVVDSLKSSQSILIVLRTYCQRVEYFEKNQKFLSRNFLKPIENFNNFDDNLLIHIRGGDILNGAGGDQYFPLPISYYKHIIEKSELAPVFFGQLDSFYGDLLKRCFKNALFCECPDVQTSFKYLMQAKTLSISISSFSWCAAFLSNKLEKLFFPVAGLFNYKENRINKMEQANFILNDERVIYYHFDNYWIDLGKEEHLFKLLNSDSKCFSLMNTIDLDSLKSLIAEK